jgi:hypothetical protein
MLTEAFMCFLRLVLLQSENLQNPYAEFFGDDVTQADNQEPST